MYIQNGIRGPEVVGWQKFLNRQGYDCGAADGIFGSKTESATKAFQAAQGLTSDGIVGPNTIAAAEKLGYKPSSDCTIPPPGQINVVVDVSHWQNNINYSDVAADGIIGVIHKATQGIGYTDPKYATDRPKALAAGLLWGAYHFGTAQPVEEQVNHFLSVAKPKANTLLALDWEENSNRSQGTMKLEQAKQFVTLVHKTVGRWPVLYGGSLIKSSVLPGGDPVLRNCPLWLSQWRCNPTLPPGWDAYTLWQYTDGASGPLPHYVNGIGNCDRDVYAGNKKQLQAMWKSGL